MNLDKNTYEDIKNEAQKEMDRVLKLEETRENLKQRLLQKIEDIRISLQAGKEALKAKDFAAAAEHYQLVIELDPENKEALKGFSRANKKLIAERKKLYKTDIKTFFAEAKIFVKNDDYKSAIESYKSILDLDPDNKKALKLLEKAEQKYSFSDDDEHYEELFGKPDLENEEVFVSGAASVEDSLEDDFVSAEEISKGLDSAGLGDKSDMEKETDSYVQDLIRESILSDSGAEEEQENKPVVSKTQEPETVLEKEEPLVETLTDNDIDKLVEELDDSVVSGTQITEDVIEQQNEAEEEVVLEEEEPIADQPQDEAIQEEQVVEAPKEEVIQEEPKIEDIDAEPIKEEASEEVIRQELSDEDIDSLINDIEPEEVSIEANAEEVNEQALSEDDIDKIVSDMGAATLDDQELSGAAVAFDDEEISGSVSVLDDTEVSGAVSVEDEIAPVDVLDEKELAALAESTEEPVSGVAVEAEEDIDMDALLAGVVDEYNNISGADLSDVEISGASDAVKSQASSEEALMDEMLAGVIDDYNQEVSGSVTEEKEVVVEPEVKEEVKEETPAVSSEVEEEAAEANSEWGMEGVEEGQSAVASPAEGEDISKKLDDATPAEEGSSSDAEGEELKEGEAAKKDFKEEEPKKFYIVALERFKGFLMSNVNMKVGTILVLGTLLALSLVGWTLFQNYTESSVKFFMKYDAIVEKQIAKADVLLKEGKTKDAFVLLSSVSGILPGESHGIDRHYNIIQMFRKKGGSDHNVLRAAIELYEDLTRKYENNSKVSRAYMEIGNCYMELKLYDDAITRYKILLQKFPTTEHVPQTLLNIGKCYLKLGQYSKAKRGLFSLYSNYTDSEYAQEALYELGNCFDAEAKKLAED